MNDYHVINDKDYNVINNITYDQLICNQKPTDYSMLFFCIKQNKSNKLASRIFYYLCRLLKTPQPSFKELINYSFYVIILFLILLSMIVILLGVEIRMMLFLTCIPISLLLYFFVQITFDSLNSITIKVADFKVGTSEINKDLMKKGYEQVLLKQYIVNTSNNSFGLVHIQNLTSHSNDINGLLVRIWPLSHMILCYKVINQYVKRIKIIKTYYLRNCKTVDSYDDNDRCCIDKLRSTANSILEIYNKAIDIDRVVIFRNETPIYCKDTI